MLPIHFFDEETSTAVIRHYKSLLPGPITVDSLNSGEKTNDGQARFRNPVKVPSFGCTMKRCGCLSCPESLSHVVTNGGNEADEVNPRMHARSREAGNLVKPHPVDPPGSPGTIPNVL